MRKPFAGDFDAQIMLQNHFYTAGLAVYIALGVVVFLHAPLKEEPVEMVETA